MTVSKNWEKTYEVFTAVQHLPPAVRAAEALRLSGEDRDLARDVLALLGNSEQAAAAHFLCLTEQPRIFGASSGSFPLIGTDIGPYRIMDLLGAGGMGEVYLAERLVPFRMTVAVKILSAGMITGTARQRFIREQQALADLYHPNIVRLLDAGETADGRPYFVMDYIDGPTLADVVRDNPLSSDDAGCLMLEITEAIGYIHKRGFLHRDLKPQNVLFDSHGRLRVTDFGVAKTTQMDLELTRTGDLLGTPSYMSPEQAEGRRQDIGPATDIYGLGAILYFLVTGRPPFIGSNPRETIRQVVDKRLESVQTSRPDLDPRLEELCLRCLEKDPARRPTSARDVGDALRAILSPEKAASAGASGLNFQDLLHQHHQGRLDEPANGTVGRKSEDASAATAITPASPPVEEMEQTALWEACVYCGKSTPDRHEVVLPFFGRNVLILQASALAMTGVVTMFAWFPVGDVRPLALAAGTIVLVLLARYSAALTRCASAELPCCAEHRGQGLDDARIRAGLLGLAALPLVIMLLAGPLIRFEYGHSTALLVFALFIFGSLGLLAALVRRWSAALHARSVTADKLVLDLGTGESMELVPKRFAGETLSPDESTVRHADAAAFLGVLAVTILSSIFLAGDDGRTPFVPVALSFLLAPSVFLLFPWATKRWYGYPALIAPLAVMTLALAFVWAA